MPRSTISQPHEYAMLAAVGDYAIKHRGDESVGFLILLGPDYSVARLSWYGDDFPRGQALEALVESAHAHVFYDPFDFPEYGWVQWDNLPLEQVDKLLGPLPGPGRADYQPSGAFMV